MGPVHLFVMMSALTFSGNAEGRTDNVLLDFTASYCGPCRAMSPMVSALERQGFPIRKVDVQQEQGLAAQYGVTQIPCFIVVVNGQVAAKHIGQCSEAELRQMLAKIPQPTAAKPAGEKNVASRPLPLKKNNSIAWKSEKDLRAPLPKVARGTPPEEEGDYLSVSARLKVTDAQGVNVGSGTVIDSRPGQSLVLTCGHIFRNMDAESSIEVELFSNGKVQKVSGKLVKHDLKSDIGLVVLATPQAVCAARIAPQDFDIQAGASVVSVGCGGGEDPTIERIKITSINRYKGPDNLECSGIPKQGRSGGGLFTKSGEVIGVCMAADPKEKKGLYCSLKPIQELLDQCKLSRVYRPELQQIAKTPAPKSLAPVVTASLDADEKSDSDPSQYLPQVKLAEKGIGLDAQDDVELENVSSDVAADISRANTTGRAAAAEALSGAEDAEIVCVVRPYNKPQAASQVIVINRASREFVSQLTGELENQPEYNRTSLQLSEPDFVPATIESAVTTARTPAQR